MDDSGEVADLCRQHSLEAVFLMALCVVIGGADSWPGGRHPQACALLRGELMAIDDKVLWPAGVWSALPVSATGGPQPDLSDESAGCAAIL